MSYVIKEPLGDFNVLLSFKGNLTVTEAQIFTFPFMLKMIGISCMKYTTKHIFMRLSPDFINSLFPKWTWDHLFCRFNCSHGTT